MKSTILFFTVLLGINAYPQDTITINNSKWIGSLHNGTRNGLWQEYAYLEYFDDYRMVSEGYFVNDTPNGVWKYFGLSHYGDMELRAEGSFVNGKKEGEWIHDGGYYFCKGKYKKGVKEGVWLCYNREINEHMVHAKENYVNGIPEGKWELYFSEDSERDGTVSASGQMSKGQMNGLWKTSGSMGELLINPDTIIYSPNLSELVYHTEQDCADNGYFPEFSGGVLSRKTGEWKYFFSDNQISCEGTYTNGIKMGIWKWYAENGEISYTGEYVNGKKEGTWKEYYDDGTLKCIDEYSNGMLHGLYTLYTREGNLFISGQFTNGYRSGEWFCLSKTGDTIHRGAYDGLPDNPTPAEPLPSRCGLEESKYEIESQLRNNEPYYLPYNNRHGAWEEQSQWTTYKAKGAYVHGKRHGEWRIYSDNTLISISNYTHGVLNGEFVEFNWNFEYVWKIGEYKGGQTIRLKEYSKGEGQTKEEYLLNKNLY
jgi:uncharacterized protein